jgi:hypothetical protein
MEQDNRKDTKTVFLIKRVKTGKYFNHLFEDNLDIAYSGNSPEDSYCYTYSLAFLNLLIDERERTGEELESCMCILGESNETR